VFPSAAYRAIVRQEMCGKQNGWRQKILEHLLTPLWDLIADMPFNEERICSNPRSKVFNVLVQYVPKVGEQPFACSSTTVKPFSHAAGRLRR
jgi:hypothetical protein